MPPETRALSPGSGIAPRLRFICACSSLRSASREFTAAENCGETRDFLIFGACTSAGGSASAAENEAEPSRAEAHSPAAASRRHSCGFMFPGSVFPGGFLVCSPAYAADVKRPGTKLPPPGPVLRASDAVLETAHQDLHLAVALHARIAE